MKMPWKRTRGAADRPEAPERPIMPERTKWFLTRCKKCKRVSWFGVPIPRTVMTKEPVEQLVRVNQGRGSARRALVTAPLRLVLSRPEKRKWRCPSCGSTECGAATQASHILALTLNAMRKVGT